MTLKSLLIGLWWFALGLGHSAAVADSDWLGNAFARTIVEVSPRQSRLGSKPRVRGGSASISSGSAALDRSIIKIGNQIAPAIEGSRHWQVTKLEWTTTDEEHYEEFIRHIGESNCKSPHECLTSSVSNPAYHARNPPDMKFFADCADLPFVLRAYFAWMNGLPFSFSSALAPHSKASQHNTMSQSFQVVGRYHIVPPGADPRQVFTKVLRVSTSHFRVPANYDGQMLPDHYPVAITRTSVKAGTVIFDALGHVAIVYKVDDDGVVHYIDAHPDGSLTRSVFGSDIERSGPDSGGGFLRWRPQKLVAAREGSDGRLNGGMLVLLSNEQLPDWSDTQYYGTSRPRPSDWRKARFDIEDEEVDYYFYVRLKLAIPGYRFDPIFEIRKRIGTLCEELQQRVDAVDAAVRAGLPWRPQPFRLPSNIYSTQGDWETYATPSRDAQLKTLFIGLREDVERFIAMSSRGSRLIRYEGDNLRADLRRAYDAASESCAITYTKTDGSLKTLSFNDVKNRLFSLSFDPHHCIERRWGASSAEELGTCPDGELKRAWYDAQQRLRNQTVRTIGDRMDFTLSDLRRASYASDHVGEDEPPVIEVSSLLGSK